MMRPGLHRRLKTLEDRLPGPSVRQKSFLPEWLVEELKEQGVRFDDFWQPGIQVGTGETVNA